MKDSGDRRHLSVAPTTNGLSRQCVAHKKTGERCKKTPIKGGKVCNKHGGAAPQVRKAARDRLLALREPAITTLGKVMRKGDTEPGVKVRAAVAVLDRTGMGPSSHVEVDILKPWQLALQELGAGGKKKSKKRKAKKHGQAE